MNAALAFFDAHPWAWFPAAAIAWAIFSAIMTTILDRWIPKSQADWDSLYERKPRMAALGSMLKSAGFNLPGAFAALRTFVTGAPPAWLLGGPRVAIAGAVQLGKELQHKADVEAVKEEKPEPQVKP